MTDEFRQPTRVEIPIPKELTKLFATKLVKDLCEGEEICQTCGGSGLAVQGYRYGLEGDPNKNETFPYNKQFLGGCPDCYNGVVKRCSKCGKLIPRHRTACDCDSHERSRNRRKEQWDAAEKVYYGDYPDQAVCYGGDNYFLSVDDFMESDEYEDAKEELADAEYIELWATEHVKNELVPGQIVDMLEESDIAYEDYEVCAAGIKAIEEFCEKWNKEFAEKSWFPTHVGIVFDKSEATMERYVNDSSENGDAK